MHRRWSCNVHQWIVNDSSSPRWGWSSEGSIPTTNGGRTTHGRSLNDLWSLPIPSSGLLRDWVQRWLGCCRHSNSSSPTRRWIHTERNQSMDLQWGKSVLVWSITRFIVWVCFVSGTLFSPALIPTLPPPPVGHSPLSLFLPIQKESCWERRFD